MTAKHVIDHGSRAVVDAVEILSVSERTVRDWLSRVDKGSKEARNKKIFDLWLASNEQKEIADMVGLSSPQVNEIISKFGIGELAKTELATAEHATDFDTPIYNISISCFPEGV